MVQREDCSDFSVNKEIDPEYARAFQEAVQQGLKVSTYACKLSPQKANLSSATCFLFAMGANTAKRLDCILCSRVLYKRGKRGGFYGEKTPIL